MSGPQIDKHTYLYVDLLCIVLIQGRPGLRERRCFSRIPSCFRTNWRHLFQSPLRTPSLEPVLAHRWMIQAVKTRGEGKVLEKTPHLGYRSAGTATPGPSLRASNITSFKVYFDSSNILPEYHNGEWLSSTDISPGCSAPTYQGSPFQRARRCKGGSSGRHFDLRALKLLP
jgi:hypothetical protein